MLPPKPEDWPRLFVNRLNYGDLEGGRSTVRFQRQNRGTPGEAIVGRDPICDALTRMIQSKTKLQSRVIKVINVDDVAVLDTDFQGTAMDALEKAIDIRCNAIEVLRRQPDGCWKLTVGDPNGRE